MTLFITYKYPLLHKHLKNTLQLRLQSRKPPETKTRELIQSQLCSKEEWQNKWIFLTVIDKVIMDYTLKAKKFELPHQEWAFLNQIKTGHTRLHYDIEVEIERQPEMWLWEQLIDHETHYMGIINIQFALCIMSINEVAKQAIERHYTQKFKFDYI